jgi:uncharacterized membrane protein YgcG
LNKLSSSSSPLALLTQTEPGLTIDPLTLVASRVRTLPRPLHPLCLRTGPVFAAVRVYECARSWTYVPASSCVCWRAQDADTRRRGVGEDPDAASPRRFAWESSQTFLQDSADGTHKDADAAGAVSRAERPPSTRTPRGSRMSPLTPVRESAEKKGSAQSWMDRNAGTGTSVNGNASGREVGGGGGGREVSGEGGGRDDGGGGMALEATLSAPLTRYLPVASLDLSPARVH